MLDLISSVYKHLGLFIKLQKLFLMVWLHVVDQIENDTWKHDLKDGTTLGNRAGKVGLNNVRVGEVLYKGNGGIIEAVKLWIESPIHNEIISDPLYQTGVTIQIPFVDDDNTEKFYIITNYIKK